MKNFVVLIIVLTVVQNISAQTLLSETYEKAYNMAWEKCHDGDWILGLAQFFNIIRVDTESKDERKAQDAIRGKVEIAIHECFRNINDQLIQAKSNQQANIYAATHTYEKICKLSDYKTLISACSTSKELSDIRTKAYAGLGLCYYLQNKYKDAVPYLLHALKWGDLPSSFYIANIKRNGGNVDAIRNLDLKKMYEITANEGRVEAMDSLATICYEQGELRNAVEWAHRAAEEGSSYGKFMSGFIYLFTEMKENVQEKTIETYLRQASEDTKSRISQNAKFCLGCMYYYLKVDGEAPEQQRAKGKQLLMDFQEAGRQMGIDYHDIIEN